MMQGRSRTTMLLNTVNSRWSPPVATRVLEFLSASSLKRDGVGPAIEFIKLHMNDPIFAPQDDVASNDNEITIPPPKRMRMAKEKAKVAVADILAQPTDSSPSTSRIHAAKSTTEPQAIAALRHTPSTSSDSTPSVSESSSASSSSSENSQNSASVSSSPDSVSSISSVSAATAATLRPKSVPIRPKSKAKRVDSPSKVEMAAAPSHPSPRRAPQPPEIEFIVIDDTPPPPPPLPQSAQTIAVLKTTYKLSNRMLLYESLHFTPPRLDRPLSWQGQLVTRDWLQSMTIDERCKFIDTLTFSEQCSALPMLLPPPISEAYFLQCMEWQNSYRVSANSMRSLWNALGGNYQINTVLEYFVTPHVPQEFRSLCNCCALHGIAEPIRGHISRISNWVV